MVAKIEIVTERKMIQFSEVLAAIFYGKNQKRHKDIAFKILNNIKSKRELNAGNKEWRRIMESFDLDPDKFTDRHIYYYTIEKLVNAGFLNKKNISRNEVVYSLSSNLSQRLKELHELLDSYAEQEAE